MCSCLCEPGTVWNNKQDPGDQVTTDTSHEGAVFTDGSRGEDGRAPGGWSKDSSEAGLRSGGKYLGRERRWRRRGAGEGTSGSRGSDSGGLERCHPGSEEIWKNGQGQDRGACSGVEGGAGEAGTGEAGLGEGARGHPGQTNGLNSSSRWKSANLLTKPRI